MDNLLNYNRLVVIYLACLAYTLTRYAYFGPIEPPNWSAYLINKSVSIFAVITFCYSSFVYLKGDHELSKQLGIRPALYRQFRRRPSWPRGTTTHQATMGTSHSDRSQRGRACLDDT